LIQPRRSSELRIAATLLAVIGVLYLARDILVPLAFGITLTLVLSPAVGWLQRLHFRRFVAALLVMVVSIAVAGGIGYVMFNQMVQVVNEMPSYRQNINNKIKALSTPSKNVLGQVAQSVKEIGQELAIPQELPVAPATPGQPATRSTPDNPVAVQVVETPPSGWAYVRDLTRAVLAPMARLALVLVLTLFLLVEQADLRNRLFRLAGLNRLNVMTQALKDTTRLVSRFLMLQSLVNAGFGVLCGIGLYLIGVPYAALWGALAAMLRIVPYIGAVVAGLLPLLLSLAVFDGWRQPLLIFVLFATLELVTGNLLEPMLYGANAGISSLALLLSTAFWATLWGPAGLVLSMPLTVCVVALGRHVPQLSFLHILLGDQPVLSADAHMYQRLLSMDDQEARAVAEDYLSDHSLLRLYDAVILPALIMAEQDRHKGALDPDREEFLFLSLREMLSEFSEREQDSNLADSGERPGQAVPGRILCIPAHDEADEIAAAMLGQLLELAGCAAVSFSLAASPQSVLGLAAPDANDILCVSSVPPFAFSHARAASQQLRAMYPDCKILVGVWGFSGEVKRALRRFQPSPPDKLASSLADALDYLIVAAPPAKMEISG
jgi:predicted PurR-regulated permease PerM